MLSLKLLHLQWNYSLFNLIDILSNIKILTDSKFRRCTWLKPSQLFETKCVGLLIEIQYQVEQSEDSKNDFNFSSWKRWKLGSIEHRKVDIIWKCIPRYWTCVWKIDIIVSKRQSYFSSIHKLDISLNTSLRHIQIWIIRIGKKIWRIQSNFNFCVHSFSKREGNSILL